MKLREALALAIGGDLAHLAEVARQLSSLGVRVELGGGVMWGPARLLGKGNNGVVVFCRSTHGDIYACKIRRGDAQRPHLLDEARYLQIANGVGVGPKLYAYTRDVLVMEYVEGTPVADWWGAAGAEERARFVADLLRQARALDLAGISHGELSRPGKHVLVAGGGRAVILDFESARPGAQNVTQAANLLRALGLTPPLEALRRYAERRDDSAFNELLSSLLGQLKR
ncbi:MAG: RIO1 family regulatory kinase/ATPase [Thermoproteus sp.]|jgi:putative serine/threonine protein kinase